MKHIKMGKQEQYNIDDNYVFDDMGYGNLIIGYYAATHDFDFDYTFIPEYEN